MGFRKKLKLGDTAEKLINLVVPKSWQPKNCNCGARKDWMNGESREEALKRLEDEARRKKYGL